MGRFKAGTSGNPAGRPKGIKDCRAVRRELFEAHAEELTQRAIDMAMAGDIQALRICIDRIIPPVREERLRLTLPPATDLAGCAAAQESILQAVAEGALLPSEGQALAALVEGKRRVIESSEIASRLEAIEKKLGIGKGP